MRKAHVLGIVLALVSTTIVVAAIVSSKCCHVRSSSHVPKPTVQPRATQADNFGTYSDRLKNGWNRTQYSSLVVFGASDCDDGHPRSSAYANTLREGSPYVGGRYTNGRVFSEYLTSSVLTGSTINDLNYAYGHATVSNDLVSVQAPDIGMQMQFYLDDITNGRIQRGDEKTGRVLHTFWIGTNDMIEIWTSSIQNGTFQNGDANGASVGIESATQRVQIEAETLIKQIKDLRSNAQVNAIRSDHLLMLLPPLEIVPNLRYQSISLAQKNMTLANIYLNYIGELTKKYNENLLKGLKALLQGNEQLDGTPSFSEQNLMFMDITDYWYYVRNNPDKYNFVNVVDACWNSTTGVTCAQPDQWEYLDTLHPTTKMHEYLAQEITVQVNL